MEIIFEILFEVIGEVLLQVLLEVLFEVGLHSLGSPFKRDKPSHPFFSALGYATYGGIAGGLSLWLVPNLFIHSHTAQVANLVIAPLVAGGTMAAMGAWRRRREQQTVLLDRFAYGVIFALAMALVRFRFGHTG